MSFPRYPKYKDSGVEWLGQVPEQWDIRKVRWLFEIKKRIANELGFDVFSITQQGIKVKDLESNDGQLSMDYSKYQIVEVGDFAMNHMDLLTGGVDIAGARGVTSPDYRVVTLRHFSTSHDRYFLYLFQKAYRNKIFYAYGQGSSQLGRWRLPTEQFKDFQFPVPLKAEQEWIAAFLDRETAKIDELVAAQQRLMDLLKEKRQAVISHAVTKGLNRNAPMKPSGIEWLGDVPAHWRVMPLGRVTVSRCDGPFGSGLKSEHYTDSGVRVIRLQNIRRDGFDDSDEAFIDADYYATELSGHDVVSGDVLIAGLGDDKNTVGRACVAPAGIEPAMVKADCFRYRLDKAQVLPEFVATELSASSAADAGMMSSGSTRSRIPLSVMATRKLAVPPMDEQKAIADFLRAESLQFDTLTTEAQRAIDLLQERRTALISAAVTGQIDVRQT